MPETPVSRANEQVPPPPGTTGVFEH